MVLNLQFLSFVTLGLHFFKTSDLTVFFISPKYFIYGAHKSVLNVKKTASERIL